MKFSIKTYSKSKIDEACEIILKYKLYRRDVHGISDICMKHLELYPNPSLRYYEIKCIIIAYYRNTPIGCSVSFYDDYLKKTICYLYVKRNFRRKKCGTRLFKSSLKKLRRKKLVVCSYVSTKFFSTLKKHCIEM